MIGEEDDIVERETLRAAQDAENREKQLQIAYRIIFSSPEGFSVLQDIVVRGHLMSTTFSHNERDHALKEGERNLMLYILSKLSAEIKNKLLEV